MKKFNLSKLQTDELNSLMTQKNQIEFSINKMIVFIVDSHGDAINKKGQWNYNDGILEVDVIPHSQTIKERIKKK